MNDRLCREFCRLAFSHLISGLPASDSVSLLVSFRYAPFHSVGSERAAGEVKETGGVRKEQERSYTGEHSHSLRERDSQGKEIWE